MHAVLDAVDHDGEDEEDEQAHFADRVSRNDPLTVLQPDDGGGDGEPDECELEQVVSE